MGVRFYGKTSSDLGSFSFHLFQFHNFCQFDDYIRRYVRLAIQARIQQILSKELMMLTEGHGRGFWNPIKPTIDYVETVGISSGTVLDAEYENNDQLFNESG